MNNPEFYYEIWRYICYEGSINSSSSLSLEWVTTELHRLNDLSVFEGQDNVEIHKVWFNSVEREIVYQLPKSEFKEYHK